MSDPARKTRTSQWQNHIEVLRRHAGEDPASYSEAVAAMEAAMTAAARRFGGYRRHIGSAQFDDVVRSVIHGQHRKRAPEDVPTGASAPVDRATPVGDPRWRSGLLAIFEWDPPVQSPAAFFDLCLEHRLIEAKREVAKFAQPHPRADDDEEDPELWKGVAVPDRSPELESVPRGVARTLGDAAAFGQLYLEVQAQLAAEQRLGDVGQAEKLQPAIQAWAIMGAFVAHDVALGPGRRRWETKGNAKDLWGRAWQSAYHRHEETELYTEESEIPSPKTDRNAAGQWYQHLLRFRRDYAGAAHLADAVVQLGESVPAIRASDASGRARLPFDWDAATHQTLERPSSTSTERKS